MTAQIIPLRTENAYEAALRTATLKYEGPMGRYGPTLDQDRGLTEWAATLPPPRQMKGDDLWWEFWELEGHTDREYGSFAYGPVCDRLGAVKEEIKRRVCQNDHLFGTGQLPNGDMHICPDAEDGPCTSPYCDDPPDEDFADDGLDDDGCDNDGYDDDGFDDVLGYDNEATQ